MRAGLFVEEFDKVFLRPSTVVVFWSGGALGEVFDGGVGLDALVLSRRFGVFGLGIDFGDEDGGFGGEVRRDGFPDGS